MNWSFSAQIERFEGEGHMHFLALPGALADEIRGQGAKRFVITVNDGVTWHCGLLGTGDGRWFVMVSKEKLKQAQTAHGGWVHVDFRVDDSKYGMAVPPDLQEMLEDDPEFLQRFDAMLPGKRRNAIHQIASAKSDATIAKRILKLMNELGLALLLLCLAIPGAHGQDIVLGNAQMDVYLPWLQSKRVAVVGNHTSVVGDVHLVDTLLARGVDIRHVFAPEHGFRGEAANGADILDGTDAATGLPVYSLHGKHRKPQPEQLADIDVVVFDIQDVGARFYTYISSLMLVMEACAEADVSLVVLDRPNPHGHHMQGPMLDPAFKSFVGFIPTPMVHGLTLGEAALMGCAEGWIEVPEPWQPRIVTCQGWSHGTDFQLAIRPSPNLPSATSIDLYPSLCLFEPTVVSVGRGTPHPFESLGHPSMGLGTFAFTPVSTPGAAPHPKHENVPCVGQHLEQLATTWRIESLAAHGHPRPGFTLEPLETWTRQWVSQQGSLDGFITSPSFFDKLAGTDALRLALEAGTPLTELKATWANQHAAFFEAARPHLLYPWNAPLPGR